MDQSCLEAKLKVEKLTNSFEKDTLLSIQFLIHQLDVLDAIEVVMLNDCIAAVDEQLDVKLWRNILYPQIDYIRRKIMTSQDEAIKIELSQKLDTILLTHSGRLSHIISHLLGEERNQIAASSNLFLEDLFSGDSNEENMKKKLLFKLFSYSGDLLRYRCSHSKTFHSFDHFDTAKEFYQLAHRIDPYDGSSFNQLAVIESLSTSKCLIKMIYLYSRALGSMTPFSVAKDNLLKLLKKPEVIEEKYKIFEQLVRIIESGSGSFILNQHLLQYSNQEMHYIYASILANCSYFKISLLNLLNSKDEEAFSTFSAEMKLLLLSQDGQRLKENKLLIEKIADLDFLSSLIGSSFISIPLQKLIKRTAFQVKKISHETVELPLSDNEIN